MSSFPVLIRPYRAIVGDAPIIADAVFEEQHDDESVLTDQPVEVGSVVTDHMYDLPAELGLIYGWTLGSAQNTQKDVSFLKNLYQKLLGLKANRTLVTVYTGKRLYKNMVVRRVSLTTDKENENSMSVRLGLRELLFATTQTVNISSAADQQFPDQTAPTVDQGNQTLQGAPNFNPGVLPG
jgi:hypothetical protein